MSRPAILKNNDIKSDVTSQIMWTSTRKINLISWHLLQISTWVGGFVTKPFWKIWCWLVKLDHSPGPHLGDPAKLGHQVTFNQTSHQKWRVDAIIGQHQSLRCTVTNGIEACEVVKILQKKKRIRTDSLKLTVSSSHLKIGGFSQEGNEKVFQLHPFSGASC